jgi:molybdate/tungstate transport system ATP-binding protein
MSRFEVQSLSVQCGAFRLDEVSVSCADGSCLAILGPSGAGKTMLIEAAVGLRRPRSGRVLIDGREVTGWPPEERGVSFLPQDLALFPHLSVRDNILFPTRARGGTSDAGSRMQALAGALGIEHVLERRDVRSLSGGEAQRVALARALIVPPKVLFLDECFASLDTPLRRRLVGELHSLRRELSLTVVVVTHDQEEACILADEVAVLEAGRILQTASPSELYARPLDERVARFLGMENTFDVEHVEHRGERRFCVLGGLEIEVCCDGPVPAQIAFFAEDVQLADGVSADARERANVLPGRVLEVLCMGQRMILRVLADVTGPGGIEIRMSVRADEARRWELGHMIWFHVAKERIRCLPHVR